jgi:hypothetical protein
MSKIKGQDFRTSCALVADESNCTVTVQGNTEDVTTKNDTAGLYAKDTVVSKQWSVQTDTYQAEVSQLRAIITAFNAAAALGVGWTVTGSNLSRGGQALLNDFTMQFDDRQTVQCQLQFQGTGALS